MVRKAGECYRNSMRRPILVILGMAILAAFWLLSRTDRETEPPESVSLSVAQNPMPAPSDPVADSETGVGEAGPPSGEAKAAVEPDGPKLAELPTREVKPRPAFTVPEDQAAPSRPITFNNGAPGGNRQAPPSGYVPSVGPGSLRPGGTSTTPVQPINGPAQVGSGTSLTVGGRAVKLFGVRPPEPSERCTRPEGQMSCREAAQALLGQRLKSNAGVHCRIPVSRPGEIPSAICLDSSGVDLGGLLVGEGLALADTSQSYDYFGAQGIARNYRKGLWASR